MTTINEIMLANSSTNSSQQKKSNLTDATKRELEALGIDPSTVKSEAEAKLMIDEAKEAKKLESEDDATSKNQNPSEREIIASLKALASKIGVSVSDDDSIEDMLCDISSKISSMMLEARSNNNDEAIAAIESIETEFEFIEQQCDNLQNAQSMLSASMNMMSMTNKMTLGL